MYEQVRNKTFQTTSRAATPPRSLRDMSSRNINFRRCRACLPFTSLLCVTWSGFGFSFTTAVTVTPQNLNLSLRLAPIGNWTNQVLTSTLSANHYSKVPHQNDNNEQAGDFDLRGLLDSYPWMNKTIPGRFIPNRLATSYSLYDNTSNRSFTCGQDQPASHQWNKSKLK